MVKVIAAVLTALYPLLVFTLLVVLKLPVRVLSLCVIALAFAAFLSAGIKGKSASAGASVGGASAGRGAFGGAATLAGGVSAPSSKPISPHSSPFSLFGLSIPGLNIDPVIIDIILKAKKTRASSSPIV